MAARLCPLEKVQYQLRVRIINSKGKALADQTRPLWSSNRPMHSLDIRSESSKRLLRIYMGPMFWLHGYHAAEIPPVEFSIDVDAAVLKPDYKVVVTLEELKS